MFGLDPLFDLDRNGRLDAFEQAARLDFLDTVDSSLRTGKSGRRKSYCDSDVSDDRRDEDD